MTTAPDSLLASGAPPRPDRKRTAADLPDALGLLGLRRVASTGRRRATCPRGLRPSAGSVADKVFPDRASLAPVPPRFVARAATGVTVALGLHAAAGGLLWNEARLLAASALAPPEPDRVVELTVLEALPPEPEVALPPEPELVAPEPTPAPKPTAPETSPPPTDAPNPAPAAPAEAGQAVALDAPSDAPPEILDFTLVSGDGPSYVGRATAADATGQVGRSMDQVARGGRGSGGAGGGPDHSRSARLPARNWDCDWPAQADALGIHEQAVLLRVDLDARGRANGVTILDDPGHGFGTAARRCARQARYEPARDQSGRPVASRLGPIRVRFTR